MEPHPWLGAAAAPVRHVSHLDRGADKVRQAAVGEGDVRAALKYGDLHILAHAPEACAARGASRHTPTMSTFLMEEPLAAAMALTSRENLRIRANEMV